MNESIHSSDQALSVIREDQGHIKTLLAHLETCDRVEQQKLLAELFLGLRIHSVVEQQLVYPTISDSTDKAHIPDCGKDLYGMLSMMLELESARERELFFQTLHQLAKSFELHVRRDETMFLRLQSENDGQLCSLARKMASCRKELQQRLARQTLPEQSAKAALSVRQQRTRCA